MQTQTSICYGVKNKEVVVQNVLDVWQVTKLKPSVSSGTVSYWFSNPVSYNTARGFIRLSSERHAISFFCRPGLLSSYGYAFVSNSNFDCGQEYYVKRLLGFRKELWEYGIWIYWFDYMYLYTLCTVF